MCFTSFFFLQYIPAPDHQLPDSIQSRALILFHTGSVSTPLSEPLTKIIPHCTSPQRDIIGLVEVCSVLSCILVYPNYILLNRSMIIKWPKLATSDSRLRSGIPDFSRWKLQKQERARSDTRQRKMRSQGRAQHGRRHAIAIAALRLDFCISASSTVIISRVRILNLGWWFLTSKVASDTLFLRRLWLDFEKRLVDF